MMKKTPTRSRPLVPQNQCKPIVGMLLGQLLNSRVASLVIQQQLWFFYSVLLNNLWLVVLGPYDMASDDMANDHNETNARRLTCQGGDGTRRSPGCQSQLSSGMWMTQEPKID